MSQLENLSKNVVLKEEITKADEWNKGDTGVGAAIVAFSVIQG